MFYLDNCLTTSTYWFTELHMIAKIAEERLQGVSDRNHHMETLASTAGTSKLAEIVG